MSKFLLRPAFSSLIGSVKLDGELDSYVIHTYLENLEWKRVKISKFKDINNRGYASKNFSLLDEPIFSELQKQIVETIGEYKSGILGYSSTEFKIINSWATRTDVDEYSNPHCHTNAFLSAVYYPSEGSDIIFTSYQKREIGIIPDEYNIWNSTDISITPEPNLLVIFPSNVWHSIKKNETGKTRYSIAMNIMPIGNIGEKYTDSELTINYGERNG